MQTGRGDYARAFRPYFDLGLPQLSAQAQAVQIRQGMGRRRGPGYFDHQRGANLAAVAPVQDRGNRSQGQDQCENPIRPRQDRPQRAFSQRNHLYFLDICQSLTASFSRATILANTRKPGKRRR